MADESPAVWVSVLRRDLAYHVPTADARSTLCGRSIIAGGYILRQSEVEAHGMTPCRACAAGGHAAGSDFRVTTRRPRTVAS